MPTHLGNHGRLHPSLPSKELLFEAVLRAATDYAVIATDLDGIITVFNQGAEQMLGYSAGEVIGKSTPLLVHVEQEVASVAKELGIRPGIEVFRSAARRGESESREWTYIRKDGTSLEVSLSVTGIFDEDGSLSGFLRIARDISEERKAQREAARASERFSKMFNASPVGTAITRVADGFVLYANPACLSALGRTADEMIGKTIHDLNVWAHPERRELFVERLRVEGSVRDIEVDIRTKLGEIRRVLTSAEVMELDGDICMVVLFYDITERKAVEDALRESEERFRQLAENMTEIVLLGTVEPFEFLYVNPAFERLYGLSKEAISRDPMSFLERVPAEDREQILLHAPGGPMDLEHRIVLPDGTTRWVRARFNRFSMDRGGEQRFVGMVEDITDRKHSEDALRAAQTEAESANRAKSEFLSRMSHELRTPLNAIIGFGQLLEMDQLSADQGNQVAHVLKAGRHLLDLINEILDLSAIEAGRLTLSIESMGLSAVAHEVVDLCGPLAARFDVAISADVDDSFHVMADRQRLKQVLLNLISNAIKYNRPDGTVALMCEADVETIRVMVRDTGLGIAPENVDRLFAPFERLGAGQDVEGTGLGLALSRRLVNVMGGSLDLTSRLGEGSTFYVDLPRARPHQDMGDDQLHRDQSVALPDGKRILYIEDNLSNLTLVEHLLTRHPNVELITAMQGRMGLELARELRPDLILLDLHLPDLSGEEVLQHLKAEPATRHIPVLVISADATPRRIDRILASGADEFVTKPFDLKRLLDLLEENLVGIK